MTLIWPSQLNTIYLVLLESELFLILSSSFSSVLHKPTVFTHLFDLISPKLDIFKREKVSLSQVMKVRSSQSVLVLLSLMTMMFCYFELTNASICRDSGVNISDASCQGRVQCPACVRISWFERKPYVYRQNNKTIGILPGRWARLLNTTTVRYYIWHYRLIYLRYMFEKCYRPEVFLMFNVTNAKMYVKGKNYNYVLIWGFNFKCYGADFFIV